MEDYIANPKVINPFLLIDIWIFDLVLSFFPRKTSCTKSWRLLPHIPHDPIEEMMQTS